MLLQSYQYKAHHATGAQQLERTGLKKAQGVNEANGKSSRCIWTLAKGKGYELHDNISLMTRNEARKAKRK